MIYHLFFTMMHFVVDAFLRLTRKQQLQCVPTQHFGLEHRDHLGLIMPFSGRFDLLLRAGHGNFGNFYPFKFKVQAPGRRCVDGIYLFLNLREILSFVKIKVPSTVLKLLHKRSELPLLIRS